MFNSRHHSVYYKHLNNVKSEFIVKKNIIMDVDQIKNL